ncbi:hypothetical protein HKD37_02G003828 [Glycine soja]
MPTNHHCHNTPLQTHKPPWFFPDPLNSSIILEPRKVEVHVHFRNYIFANQRTRSSSNMLVRELTTVQCMHSLHPMQKKRHQCVKRGDDSDDAANSKEKEMIEMDRLPIWRPEIANYGDSRNMKGLQSIGKPNKKYSSLMMGKQK